MKTWFNWDKLQSNDVSSFNLNEEEEDIVMKNISKKGVFKALDYEANVYKFITERVLMNGVCNNLIPFIALTRCDSNDILKQVKDDELKRKVELAAKLGLEFNILTTGTGKQGTMYELFDMLKDPTKFDVPSILIQCLYAILVMETLHMNHNDLHSGNILIEVLEDPIEIEMKEFDIRFQTRFIPKIFDFDHAYVEELGPNPLLKSINFLTTRTVNRFRKGIDYYQFICECLTTNTRIRRLMTLFLKELIEMPYYQGWRPSTNKSALIADLTAKESEFIEEYIASNPDKVSRTEQGDVFFEIDRDTALDNLDASITKIFEQITNTGDIERFSVAGDFYFQYKSGLEQKIIYTSGWYCQSQFDFSKNVLVPLQTVFDKKEKYLANILSELKA